jgi:dsDNA-binding SOS-regulon protein
MSELGMFVAKNEEMVLVAKTGALDAPDNHFTNE